MVVEEDRNIIELISQGHSDADGLCPALSTLQYTFWYSVKSFAGASCDLSTGNGFFHYTFSKKNKQIDSLYENLCSFFFVGIQMLQKEFSTKADGELSVSIIKKIGE